MNSDPCKPPAPAPGFAGRFGDIVDRRRGTEFQELKSENLVNRLSGAAMPFGWTVNPFRGSLVSMGAELRREIAPGPRWPDRRLDAVRLLAAEGIRPRLFLMPVLPLLTDGEASLRELLAAALAAGAREVISQPLFLRTEMTWRFFLDFVGTQFTRGPARYP